jgi:hypothetical protein
MTVYNFFNTVIKNSSPWQTAGDLFMSPYHNIATYFGKNIRIIELRHNQPMVVDNQSNVASRINNIFMLVIQLSMVIPGLLIGSLLKSIALLSPNIRRIYRQITQSLQPNTTTNTPQILTISDIQSKSPRTQALLKALQSILTINRKYMCTATDGGDCFFDALRQVLLPVLHRNITVKEMRQTVYDFAKTHPSDRRCSQIDETMLITSDEGTPVWGSTDIALILAEVYKIRINIYCAQTNEGSILDFLNWEEKGLPTYSYMSTESREMHYEQIILSTPLSEGSEIIDGRSDLHNRTMIVDLAIYMSGPNGHFMPVFTRL